MKKLKYTTMTATEFYDALAEKGYFESDIIDAIFEEYRNTNFNTEIYEDFPAQDDVLFDAGEDGYNVDNFILLVGSTSKNSKLYKYLETVTATFEVPLDLY